MQSSIERNVLESTVELIQSKESGTEYAYAIISNASSRSYSTPIFMFS